MAYSRGIPPPVSHGTVRSEACADLGRARLPPFSCRLERALANELIDSLQGLELLVTVLLARNRQPPPMVAAGEPHAELAAELITLPSGLLAMVCEAIGKLKVRHGACACVGVRVCTVPVRIGQFSPPRGGPTVSPRLLVLLVLLLYYSPVLLLLRTCSAGFRCGRPVSECGKARAPLSL